MEKEKRSSPFENVKDQIGSCGIWCGSCVAGNGVLRELTKRYEKIIKDYGLKGWAPGDFDFEEFSKGLASIKGMPLCPGCLKGGGRDDCDMRTCAADRNLVDCSECQESACKHEELLQKMRTGARDAGLFVKTEDIDKVKPIERWTHELKSKWPCSILFTNEG